jgi:HK97 family phage major capsid protein
MNLEQIRARLAAISAQLEGIVASDDGYSDDQIAEIEKLNAEFESLTSQQAALEKVEAMKAKTSASAGRKVAAAVPSASQSQPQVIRSASDKFGGFQNSGQFLMAVKDAGSRGIVHERLQNVMYEKNGEDGGFLVPEDISDAIVTKLADKDQSLLAQTRQAVVSGNAMSFPVDESAPWNSGVVAYWVAEGAPFTPSQPKLSNAHLRLHKLGAMVKATDEMLEDVTALESWIKTSAPEAIMHKANSAILNGDGVGKPTGILQSAFTYQVAKETGQAADTIVPANIIKMYSRMLPSALSGAKWYVNAGAMEQFVGMKDAAGNYIFLQGGTQMNQGP